MERNRESRRGTTATNGLSRRRHRSSSSLRDSPEEDGVVEIQESGRLRDRGSKKDRERDRDQERDRDRDRSSRCMRRRGNREEGGEESTEDSIDDEEEEDDEDPSVVIPLRLTSMNPTPSAAVPMSSSTSTAIHNHQRKNFPTKVLQPVAPWKASEEMIAVSVPRKARSASVKRSHECWISGGGSGGGSNGGEPIQRQTSTSPARPISVVAVPAAPISPSSSNASVRKKMKSIGTKHRPPKVSKTSSIQENEIEIEIAEVLYGMTRLSSRDANGSSNDAKSRGSSPSPISISPPTAVLQSSVLLPNSNSTIVAPKRKRPRPIKLEEESPTNYAIPDTSISSPVKIVPASENGWGSVELGISQISMHPLLPQDSANTGSNPIPNPEPPKAEAGCQDEIETKEIVSPVMESPCAKIDTDLEDATTTKPESAASTVDCLPEKRFKINLMVSPSGKSSPEIDDAVADLVTVQKPLALEKETTVPNKETVKGAAGEKAEVIVEEAEEVGLTMKKETIKEELDVQKKMVKERILTLQVDVEKVDKDGDKLQVQKQPTKSTRNESKAENAVQSASLSLPMTIAGWPGRLPPIGYIGQIPPSLSAVSMDGGTGSAMALQPPNFPLPQSRPKRCATHFYIAQNIDYHKRLAQMNAFWPGAAGSAALYGTKTCNLNVGPPSDSTNLGNPLHGSFVGRNLSSLQDKDSSASLVDRALKDKNSPAMIMDTTQRKPLMLQQATQPASANNILAPAFIFPLNQQQPVAVTRSGAVKPAKTSGTSSSSAPNSVVGSMASSEKVTATNMSFNYANLPTNEAQYFAMLQSNSCPFPIPAHVGAPLQYRGSHHPAVPVPFFNGPLYSPQMLHPSQLQQQQLQHHPLSQPPSVQLVNQNTSTASGSQKHQLQQRMQGCIVNEGGGTSNAFPTLKQCQQHSLPPHNSRPLENDMGNCDNPCTADSRVSIAQKSVYNHNFPMTFQSQNFIMSPAALSGGNQGEKQRQPQQSLKGGNELSQSQAFAMSFAAFNGAAAPPGLDFSSMAQSHAIFQGLPEEVRHGYQMAASAACSRTSQQKNHQTIEGKPVNSINSNASGEDERKKAEKAPTTISHTTFSRPDNNPSMSTSLGNGMVDSSSQTLNAIPTSGNGSRTSSRSGAVPASTTGTTAVTNTTPSSHYYQQQLIQHHKQQQQYAARMTSASSNANVYSDRLPSAMGKFPNAVSVFPQAPLTQGSSPTLSPQWKNPAKAGTTPSPSLLDASMPSAKNLPQQQVQTQLGVPSSGHTQISFGMNTKSSSGGQQFPSNNPPPSSAVDCSGSPTTSVSKSAGGSPGTATGSMASLVTMPLSSQRPKSTPSSSSRKSSPVSSQHVPASLSNSNLVSAQSSFVKSQQQQLQKQSSQQAQAFFNIYKQTQSPSSTTNNSTSEGYQKRQSEQQQQQQYRQQQQQQYWQQHQQQQNSLAVSSTGMLSLGSQPVPFSGGSTSDPAKAVAPAAANNLKGLHPQGFLHAAQFAAQSAGNPHLLMSAAIPYIHSMPAVPVKTAEQKPAAGN